MFTLEALHNLYLEILKLLKERAVIYWLSDGLGLGGVYESWKRSVKFLL